MYTVQYIDQVGQMTGRPVCKTSCSNSSGRLTLWSN